MDSKIIYGKKCLGTIAIMAGLPSLQTEFAWSAMQMIQYNQEFLCKENEYIHYIKSPFSGIAEARNWVVDNTMGEWVLMLDCDHWFNPNILARLLRLMKKYDIPVISGLYQFRAEPYPAVMYAHSGKEEAPFALLDYEAHSFDRANELIEIGSCGGGCLLVKNNVFVEIKEKLGEKPFGIKHPFTVSEDHCFFLRLKQLNIPVHIAPWIECHHINTVKLSIEDYQSEYKE